MASTVAEITAAGHEAAIEVISDQDPVRYRVLSGQYGSRSAAEAFVDTLNSDTGHFGFVVRIAPTAD